MNKYLGLFLYFLAGYATIFFVNFTFSFQLIFIPPMAAAVLYAVAAIWLYNKHLRYKIAFMSAVLAHLILFLVLAHASFRLLIIGVCIVLGYAVGYWAVSLWKKDKKGLSFGVGSTLLIALLTTVFFGMQAYRLHEANDSSKSGKFPSIEVVDINGNELKTENLMGLVTVVTTWTKNCAYCKPLIRDLGEFSTNYRPNEVNFIALHAGKDSITVFNEYVSSSEPTGRIEYWYDKDKVIMDHFKDNTVPWTYIIDERGNVVKAYGGYGKSMQIGFIKQVKAEIDALLGQ